MTFTNAEQIIVLSNGSFSISWYLIKMATWPTGRQFSRQVSRYFSLQMRPYFGFVVGNIECFDRNRLSKNSTQKFGAALDVRVSTPACLRSLPRDLRTPTGSIFDHERIALREVTEADTSVSKYARFDKQRAHKSVKSSRVVHRESD